MRFNRRLLLRSALVLGAGIPTLAPPPTARTNLTGAGVGLAAIAIGAAPADWRTVFAGDADWGTGGTGPATAGG